MLIPKKSFVTVAFFFSYFLFLLFSMMGHIPTIGGYLKELTNVGLVLIVIIILLKLHDYSINEVSILVGFSIFGIILAIRTNDYAVFKLCMMIFAAKGIDYNNCVKFDLVAKIYLSFTIILLYFSGLAPDVTSDYNGVVRHSVGFQNPNHVGIVLFLIILEYLYLNGMKMSLSKYFIVIVILTFLDKIAGSRTAELSIILVLLLATVYTYYPKFYLKKTIQVLMKWVFIFCSIVTFLALLLYQSSNSFILTVDRKLSYRITNVSYYFDRYDISILGNDTSNFGRTLDSFYGYTFIVLGVLTFILLLVCYSKLMKILLNRNIALGIVIFCMAIYGLSERLWMYVDYNILMLSFAELVYPQFADNPLDKNVRFS